MPLYVATYVHPNLEAWGQHVDSHIAWLLAQLKSGTLLASGPLVATAEKSALLILKVRSLEEANSVVATDPFMLEGLVTELKIVEWDPIFGDYNAHSSYAGVTSLPPGVEPKT